MSAPVKHYTHPSRKRRFSMLMTLEERAALDKLAQEKGVTAADVIRMFLRGTNFFERAA